MTFLTALLALRLDLWYVLWHGWTFGPFDWLWTATQFAFWTLGVNGWAINWCYYDWSAGQRVCEIRTW